MKKWKGPEVYHLTVSGANPYRIADEMNESTNPFGGSPLKAYVIRADWNAPVFTGGVVEVWSYEFLSPEQAQYIVDNQFITDVVQAEQQMLPGFG